MQVSEERYFAFCFLFVLVVLAAIWFIPSSYPASVRVAAMGGTLAFLGVILMALPVLRVGPYQYITNVTFEEVDRELAHKKAPPTREELDKLEEQRIRDLLVQNIFGPYMIGIGTFVNGISGFFG